MFYMKFVACFLAKLKQIIKSICEYTVIIKDDECHEKRFPFNIDSA